MLYVIIIIFIFVIVTIHDCYCYYYYYSLNTLLLPLLLLVLLLLLLLLTYSMHPKKKHQLMNKHHLIVRLQFLNTILYNSCECIDKMTVCLVVSFGGMSTSGMRINFTRELLYNR